MIWCERVLHLLERAVFVQFVHIGRNALALALQSPDGDRATETIEL